jgi:hypothetical protein
MAIRKAMSKKTDPPKKKTTSAAGPYKTGMKTDKSVGVRKMTKPAAPKAKGGSQFLPKGVPAGSKANTPKSKTKPQTKNVYPGSLEEGYDKIKSGAKRVYNEGNEKIWGAREWLRKDLGLPKR